jgi:hypothetical protein
MKEGKNVKPTVIPSKSHSVAVFTGFLYYLLVDQGLSTGPIASTLQIIIKPPSQGHTIFEATIMFSAPKLVQYHLNIMVALYFS